MRLVKPSIFISEQLKNELERAGLTGWGAGHPVALRIGRAAVLCCWFVGKTHAMLTPRQHRAPAFVPLCNLRKISPRLLRRSVQMVKLVSAALLRQNSISSSEGPDNEGSENEITPSD